MIIACDDCHREISDRAPACPHCGRPADPPGTKWREFIRERPAQLEPPVTTIQLTGKRIKANWLAGVLLFWGSVVGIFVDGKDAPAWLFFMACGIVIVIVARAKRWWHHG